jgi:hypothetical protein
VAVDEIDYIWPISRNEGRDGLSEQVPLHEKGEEEVFYFLGIVIENFIIALIVLDNIVKAVGMQEEGGGSLLQGREVVQAHDVGCLAQPAALEVVEGESVVLGVFLLHEVQEDQESSVVVDDVIEFP